MGENLEEELCEEHRTVLYDLVRDLLKTENFHVNIEPGSKKGDNFLGIVYRIHYKTQYEKNKSRLILKVAPSDYTRREIFHIRECFLHEIYVYEEILPFFKTFQESKDIPIEEVFHEYCQYYKSIDTEPIECLFFEDLTESNVTMIHSGDITVEHILLVMKLIGKFHAISFALKEQQPEKFGELVSELREPIYKCGYNYEDIPIGFTNAAKNMINSITDDSDAHLLQALLKIYEKTQFETLCECIDGNAAEPFSVVTHGDMWLNNTMYEHDDEHRPINAVFIDWQLTRYSSPVLDLMYFIFVSVDTELRRTNYDICLKTYHESLASHLIRLGSNPEEIFPYSALEDQLRKFGKYGLVSASILVPLFTSGEGAEQFTENLQNSEDDNDNAAPELPAACKQRLRDIVADMYNLGYI